MAVSVLLASPEALPRIGRAKAAALRDLGLDTVAQLIGSGGVSGTDLLGADGLAHARSAAILMTLDGMTSAVAEALVDAGMSDLDHLRNAPLRRLESAMVDRGQDPDLYRLAGFQQQAWRRKGTGMIAIRVSDANDVPQSGVAIRIGARRTRTDEAGWAALDDLPADAARIEVSPAEVTVGWGLPIRVQPERLVGPIRLRLPNATDIALRRPAARRQSEGNIVISARGTTPRVQTIELADLPDGAYLVVREALADGRVPLVSLDKRRRAKELLIDRVVVAAAAMPAGTEPGALVHLVNGSLEATTATADEVSRAWWPAPGTLRRFEFP